MGVPSKEALDDIGTKSRKAAIHINYDGEAYWVRSLGKIWLIQNVDQ